MYIPAAFRETDRETLLQAIEGHGLALLVTQGPHGLCANHLPLLLTREGETATLHGHLARGNLQWHDLATGAPALIVFSGPEGYVSPGFYPSKAQNPAVVPTWNYLAIQARGTPEVFEDPERLLALVSALTRHHEAPRAQPWAVEDAPRDYLDKMLRAIVGFSMPIAQLEGKRKLSQNRSAEDQQGVIEGMASSPRAAERALAAAMGQRDESLSAERK